MLLYTFLGVKINIEVKGRQSQHGGGSKGENNMFKKIGLLKLGGCVLALGLLNALINPEDEKEVKKEAQVVEEVKNEIDYNALEIEDIKEVIYDVLKDKKKEEIINIKVTDKNYLFIDLKDDNASSAFFPLNKSNELYNELKKFTKAEQINIFWHSMGITDLGQEVELIIVKTGFSKEALNKINFEKFPISSYKKYALPYFVHPAWSIK